ncbi:MAG: hypothetical protein QOD53_1493 [Thermoleophilaceae bacterium]|nr:hypothetical protein [Thermoleophilaceae bacterium]
MSRTIVSVVVAAALVAGCGGGGGGDKATFKSGYASINRDLLTLGSDVGQLLSQAKGQSDAALAGRFKAFGARLTGIRARLDKLKPPNPLRAPASALSAAMLKLIADLSGISTAATVHDATAARAATQALVRDSPALATARRKLAAETGAAVGP